MIRRAAALIGILLILTILISLVWTVYLHKQRTLERSGASVEVISESRNSTQRRAYDSRAVSAVGIA